MTNIVTSTTKPSAKDYWQTTDYAYRDACALCGVPEFHVDVAASKDNSKCIFYIGEKSSYTPSLTGGADALSRNWLDCDYEEYITPRSVWCNPPFSRKVEFLQKAYEQRADGLICMMLPYEPCTKWWRNNVDGKASIVYVPDGRYNYIDPETGREAKGVNFASAFVVFTTLTMPTTYVQFKRGVGNGK